MIDLFKKDLEVELNIIQESLNSCNYSLEQICILSFLIIEQKQGQISINELCQRIVSSMNNSTDINDAKTIATYVFNKYDSYVRAKHGNTVEGNSSTPQQAPQQSAAQTHAELVAKQIMEQLYGDYSKGTASNHPTQNTSTPTNKPSSPRSNSTATQQPRRDSNQDKKKDWSAEITLAGIALTSIALCYLLELRWGYTFLFIIGIFMLIGLMESFFKKNKKLEEKVHMILFGGLGGVLSITSLVVMLFCASPRYEKACKIDTVEAYQQFINKHPLSSYVSDAKAKQNKLRKLAKNRLEHGAEPYSYIYGSNSYYGRSAIKVVAPSNSDLVVLVKEDNSYGDVVAHAYLRSGCSYTFNLPNGTYQTFFYYGSGWNPNKKQGSVKGGFMNNETFSKDNPQDLYDTELTYTLQLTTSGNFRTKGSSRGEVF